ncbi:Endonuclease/exonuclease/phosphatase protein [Raphanus sativus]|nr:Endonuclease/exonuclease/phosphatase protein [Raphanus sativus]
MAASFKAHSSLSRRSVPEALLLCGAEDSAETTASYSPNSPTVFKASNFAPCSSGIVNKRNSARKRPPKSVRRANQQGNKSTQLVPFEEKRDGKMVVGSKKKKCSPEEKEVATTSKDVCLKPAHDGKSIVWERLSRLGVQRSEPWCIVGDFNEILNNDEKCGGPKRSPASFKPFADMLSVCGMEELASKGNRFT